MQTAKQQLIIYDYEGIVKRSKISADSFRAEYQGPTLPRELITTDAEVERRVFKFLINPTKLTISYAKAETAVYTKAGWEVLFWTHSSDELIVLTYSGTSGILYDYDSSGKIINVDTKRNLDITLSSAWKKLEECKQFFLNTKNDLVLVFDDIFYVGFFKTFTVERDAHNPYQILYSFVFNAYPN